MTADFHHIEFAVSNALQTSYWYCICFGFERFVERRCDEYTAVGVRNGKSIFVFKSFNKSVNDNFEREYLLHGDAVSNIAFRVDSADEIHKSLHSNQISIVEDLTENFDDYGCVKIVTVQRENDFVKHSLIECSNYSGSFLPGYLDVENVRISSTLTPIPVLLTDHAVQNFPTDGIEEAAGWYAKALNLHRFWSIDDKTTSSEYSAMKAWLVTNDDQRVQMTLAEPVTGSRKGRSQIQEFVDYNGGSGIQHIALLVDDIISTVTTMKQRGVDFLNVPASYYDDLRARLSKTDLTVTEEIDKLRELSILMDFDENGYLLQIFTKPVQDRPTLFMEIIQRRNFAGFGAGNFKALFDAVEREQALRGTLEGDLNNN